MPAPIPVVVLGGARGRLGSAIAGAVDAADDLTLHAAPGRGDPRPEVPAGAVVVDVTTPDAVSDNVSWALRAGCHVVVGTSGVDAGRIAALDRLRAGHPASNVAVVPNFSIGAALCMRFAALAAPHFDDVEIVEYAGSRKKDAPSGSAVRTAELVAAARGSADAARPDAGGVARGALVAGVEVHSLRLGNLLSGQQVRLCQDDEVLTVGFDTLHRNAFLPGALHVIRRLPAAPGLRVGLESYLDLG